MRVCGGSSDLESIRVFFFPETRNLYERVFHNEFVCDISQNLTVWIIITSLQRDFGKVLDFSLLLQSTFKTLHLF